MARKVFYSFHYKNDSWRVSQVKQMGAVDGQPVVTSNKWEEVKKGGEAAIKKWITDNMAGKSCLVVLVGEKTAGRKWVKYEIQKAWNDGKGVLGVYIHNLKDSNENQSSKGSNPFTAFSLENGKKMSDFAVVHDPPYSLSTNVYNYIKENLEDWVESAIELRKEANK